MPHCTFCLKVLPTTSGVLKHIQNTYDCHQARIRQIKNIPPTDVADLEVLDEDKRVDAEIPDAPLDDWQGTHKFDPTTFLGSPPDADEPFPPYPPRPERHVDVDCPEDKGDLYGTGRYVRKYPHSAGAIISEGETAFERIRREQMERGEEPWVPFSDQDEWGLAKWLTDNVGQRQTDVFLKLRIVRQSSYLLDLTLPYPRGHFTDPRTHTAVL